MARRSDFKATADHRAMQHGDHRHLAELDLLEDAMPEAGVLDAGCHVALGQFGEIEAGAEIVAFAGQHHGADTVRDRREERFDAEHGGIVERVALLRTHELEDCDCALPLGAQRRRQVGEFGG